MCYFRAQAKKQRIRSDRMCYDCGCGIPNDAMGKGHAGVEPGGTSITEKTFEAAAKAEGISVLSAKRHTYQLLRDQLESKKS